MQNVTLTVTGNKLVITCDLDHDTTPSASGKTQVIASTRGNAAVEYKGSKVFLGLNLYRK